MANIVHPFVSTIADEPTRPDLVRPSNWNAAHTFTPATNDYTWAQIDKTTSSIADITTKSHTLLTDIGSNTHAQIDSHLADNSQAHSDYLLNTGDTGIGDYTFDGAVTINEAGADKDFRIESSTYSSNFFIDAGVNRIHLGEVNIGSTTGQGTFNFYGNSPVFVMIDESNSTHWQFGSVAGFFRVAEADNTGAMTGIGQILKIGPASGPSFTINASKYDIDIAMHGGTTSNLFYLDAGEELIKLNTDLVLPLTSGNGIKVDTSAGNATFGWRDLRAEIRTRGVGGTDPNDVTYIGNVKAYSFSVNDEAWIEFHIPHDYVKGTDILLHFHWSHNSADVTGGSITLGADVTYAKGHDQAAFAVTVNPTLSPNASTTQYKHIISEIQLSASSPSATQIDTDDLEPDGLILARVYLSTNDITSDNGVPDPFIHEVDIHYQSTNIATKQNAPDFYV